MTSGRLIRRTVSVSPSVTPMTRPVNGSADADRASRRSATAKASGYQARARPARVFRKAAVPLPAR
jgi:hypothetical protein